MDAMTKFNWLVEVALRNMERPYTLSRAAEYLGISKSFLYKLTYSNQITHSKPTGKLIYFQKVHLDEWAYKNKRIGTDLKKITKAKK